MRKHKKTGKQSVYTLLIEVGRSKEDGLPKNSTGAALMCYSSGINEEEAVREATLIVKKAGLAPLNVTSYGDLEERLSEGHDISKEEHLLIKRVLDENVVLISQTTAFYD